MNVSTYEEAVKAEPAQVLDFATEMGQKGIYNPTTAGLRKTALRRLVKVLGDDEDYTAERLMKDLDVLIARMARLNNERAETANTYKTRVKVLLEDFLAFHKDPLAFEAKKATSGGTSSKKRRAGNRKRKGAAAAEPRQEPEPKSEGRPMRIFPLDEDRELRFQEPRGGCTVDEVLRASLHMLTLATDFDPFNREQAERINALVRQG